MNFKTDLDFAFDVTKSDGYSSRSILASKKYDEFIYRMKRESLEDESSLYAHHHITTRVKKRFLRKDLYLMVLDCDSREDASLAEAELNRQRIKGFFVESTPDHFWIICDFVATVPEIIEKMAIIPGVDREFVKHIRGKGKINLRAYPKRDGVVPIFRGYDIDRVNWVLDSALSAIEDSFLYTNWLLDFYKYWNDNEDMRIIVRQRQFRLSRRMGRNPDTIVDPLEFPSEPEVSEAESPPEPLPDPPKMEEISPFSGISL